MRSNNVGKSSRRKQSACNRTIKNEHPDNWQFKLFNCRYFIVLLPRSKLYAKAPSPRYLCFFARTSLQALQESQRLRTKKRPVNPVPPPFSQMVIRNTNGAEYAHLVSAERSVCLCGIQFQCFGEQGYVLDTRRKIGGVE